METPIGASSSSIKTFSVIFISKTSNGNWDNNFSNNLLLNISKPKKPKLSIYPNPSSRSIKIQGIYKEQTYKIYNLIGAEVLRGSINFNENIEIHNLKKGLYFLKLKNGDAIKFIKK